MSRAQLGFGTKLKVGDGATPEVFTTIPECGDIDAFDAITLDTQEVTNQDSPGNQKEYIAGLVDVDEISTTVNFIPSDVVHQQIREDAVGRVTRNWQLVTPDGVLTLQGPGFITSWSGSAPVNDKLSRELHVKPASAWEETNTP